MYAVVIGNLVRVFGPFPNERAAYAFAKQFDIGAEEYNPGRWKNYGVSVVPLTDPKIHPAATTRRDER